MSTHNICFCREIRKILCGYPLLSVAMTYLIVLSLSLVWIFPVLAYLPKIFGHPIITSYHACPKFEHRYSLLLPVCVNAGLSGKQCRPRSDTHYAASDLDLNTQLMP